MFFWTPIVGLEPTPRTLTRSYRSAAYLSTWAISAYLAGIVALGFKSFARATFSPDDLSLARSFVEIYLPMYMDLVYCNMSSPPSQTRTGTYDAKHRLLPIELLEDNMVAGVGNAPTNNKFMRLVCDFRISLPYLDFAPRLLGIVMSLGND